MKKILTSNAINFIPNYCNDDGTRLQMAASQMKQTVDMVDWQFPYINTGLEYLFDNISLNICSEIEGYVRYIFEDCIVVEGETQTEVYFLKENYKPIVKVDEKVKENQILARKKETISEGRNLLTLISPWYCKGYEDAIIISEDASKKMRHVEMTEEIFKVNQDEVLLKITENDIFRNKGDVVKSGDPLLRIKKISDNEETLMRQPIMKTSPVDGIIKKVTFYINKYNKNDREYEFILMKILQEKDKIREELFSKINNLKNWQKTLLQQKLNLLPKAKYKCDNEIVDMVVKYDIESIYDCVVGDKLANRHGNKGIISTIVSSDLIPRFGDTPVDIIINPLGIISRMNIGQLFELHLGLCVEKIRYMCSKMEVSKIKDFLFDIIKIIDNTFDNWYTKQTIDFFNNNKLTNDQIFELGSNFTIMQPAFESTSGQNVKKLLDFLKLKFEYNIYDPISKQKLISKAVGFMYWQKLDHLIKNKITARSCGKYTSRYNQPVSGRKNKGGQKFGEMEVWAIIAHDSLLNLRENLTLKSDDSDARKQLLKNILIDGSDDEYIFKESNISKTYKLFLNGIGTDLVKLSKDEVLEHESSLKYTECVDDDSEEEYLIDIEDEEIEEEADE